VIHKTDSGKQQNLKKELARLIGNDKVLIDEPMSLHTTMKVGGPASFFLKPSSEKDLTELITFLRGEDFPFFILGKGSNIVTSDAGFHGAMISIGEGFDEISIFDEEISAGAGASLSAVCNAAADAGLTGMEAISGIPGSVGGAVFMNAGAYGSEISEVIKEVRAYYVTENTRYTLSSDKINYSYRNSIFQEKDSVILSAKLSLNKGDLNEIKAKMMEYSRRRNEKQPMDQPSAGSFFKRPKGKFAGALIEAAGLKGTKIGGAEVSEKHAGFIINTGEATASDVIALMNFVKEKVFEHSGIKLEPEPVILTGETE